MFGPWDDRCDEIRIGMQSNASNVLQRQQEISNAYNKVESFIESVAEQAPPIATPLNRASEPDVPGTEPLESDVRTAELMSDDDADWTLQQILVSLPPVLRVIPERDDIAADPADTTCINEGNPQQPTRTTLPETPHGGTDDGLTSVRFRIPISFAPPESVILQRVVLLVELSSSSSVRPVVVHMNPEPGLGRETRGHIKAAVDLGKAIPAPWNVFEFGAEYQKDFTEVHPTVESWGVNQSSIGWRVSGVESCIRFEPEISIEFDRRAPLTVNAILHISAGKQGLFAHARGKFAHPMWYGYHADKKRLTAFDFLNVDELRSEEQELALILKAADKRLDWEAARAEAESIVALRLKKAREESELGHRLEADFESPMESRLATVIADVSSSANTERIHEDQKHALEQLMAGNPVVVDLGGLTPRVVDRAEQLRTAAQLLEPVDPDSAERAYLSAAEIGSNRALDRLEHLHPWKRWFYRLKTWMTRRRNKTASADAVDSQN